MTLVRECIFSNDHHVTAVMSAPAPVRRAEDLRAGPRRTLGSCRGLMLGPTTLLALCVLRAAVAASAGTGGGSVRDISVAKFERETGDGGWWLVELYAPWCTHCKALAPTWEAIGAHFEGRLRVARVDAASGAERLPVRADGFPTIVLYRAAHAGERSVSVYYVGTRTFADIAVWTSRAAGVDANLWPWQWAMGVGIRLLFDSVELLKAALGTDTIYDLRVLGISAVVFASVSLIGPCMCYCAFSRLFGDDDAPPAAAVRGGAAAAAGADTTATAAAATADSGADSTATVGGAHAKAE